MERVDHLRPSRRQCRRIRLIASPSTWCFSADYALAPGLELAGDLGLFDNDGTDPDYRGGDQGWQAVGRLGVAF